MTQTTGDLVVSGVSFDADGGGGGAGGTEKKKDDGKSVVLDDGQCRR